MSTQRLLMVFVVIDTTKIQLFKQITTVPLRLIISGTL